MLGLILLFVSGDLMMKQITCCLVIIYQLSDGLGDLRLRWWSKAFPLSLSPSLPPLSLFKIQFYCLVDRNSDWWSYCPKVLRAFEWETGQCRGSEGTIIWDYQGSHVSHWRVQELKSCYNLYQRRKQNGRRFSAALSSYSIASDTFMYNNDNV